MLFDRKEIFEGRVIKVSVDTVDLPNGVRLPLEIVRHPGGAAAVAIDADNRVCLLRQYRHAAGGYIHELPAGKLEPDEPPEVTVQRELAEEAAVSAGAWESLGAYFSSPGVFTEVIHLYLATDLTPADGGAGSRRSVPGRMVAARRGRRESAQRRTHRRQDHHRDSASRGTTKNCVKRLHRPRFEVAEMVAMSNNENGASVILGPCQITIQTDKPPQAANRRRVSQIVHDDRGNARVEWIDAGYAGVPLERAPLSIESTPARGENAKLTVERKRAGGFDPYARVGAAHIPEPKKPPVKRDLRKLGEWIKLKRELDDRKVPGRPRRRVALLRRRSLAQRRSKRSRVALDVAQLAHVPPAIEPA